MYISIFAIITTIIALICVLGYIFKVGSSNTIRKLGVIFGIITFILAITAVIYFMIGWNNQVQEGISAFSTMSGTEVTEIEDIGFWYSQRQDGNVFTMGPGYAWYLMIIAGIITMISSLFIIIKEKPKTEPEPPK
jgi:hypothetical protein